MTLNALATALEGRGDQLGDNLETIDAYLKRLNPEIPPLVEDLRLTADVSDIYADVLPEVADILRTPSPRRAPWRTARDKLNALFKDVDLVLRHHARLPGDNGDNLIRLGQVSAQQLAVLAALRPGVPCLLSGIVKAGMRQAEAFRNFTLHISSRRCPTSRAATTPGTSRVFGDDSGPAAPVCPTPASQPGQPGDATCPDFNDGVNRADRQGHPAHRHRLRPSTGRASPAAPRSATC